MDSLLRKSKGFTLVEVMVTLVVLAIGILALSQLQSVLIRSTSDANSRSVAVAIAQEKIDDLKSFPNLTVGSTTDAIPDTWAAGIARENLAFEHITGGANGTGGEIPPGTITVDPFDYTLDWDVTDYYYVDKNEFVTARTAAEIVADGDTVPDLADKKLVTVNVAWVNESNETETVSLQTIVDGYAPLLTAVEDNPKDGGTPPKVKYVPELAPDVIDTRVDTASNKFRQTSKPLPDVVKTGQNSNTLVTFEVVTYSENTNPDLPFDFFEDSRDEYITLDCKCQFSTTEGSYLAAAHTRWDEDEQVKYDYAGEYVTKQTATQVDNANAVDEYCEVCCRDHHDATASTVKYVPGTVTDNHVHYQEDGSVASQASGDEYIESCRLKRVDGILRVFQDWQLYDLTVMNRAELADSGSLQTPYSTYVGEFVLEEVANAGNPDKPSERSPIEITEGESVQLSARAIYIDDVYDESGTVNPTSYIDYLEDTENTDRLDKIPFSEVNLTLLSDWTSSDDTKATVTNEAVATISDPANDYYGTYSRGYATAISESGGDPDITATLRDGNEGISQKFINPSPTTFDDQVRLDIAAGLGPVNISGSYTINFPLGRSGSPTISGTNGAVCTLPAGNTYTCSVTAPWTGTITLSIDLSTGPKASRCSGSATYNGVAISIDTTHNFPAFDCD